MDKREIMNSVREYARVVSSHYPVRRMFLYGSYAYGTPRHDSDIDIAIVLEKKPEDKLQVEAEMFRLGMDVDVRIEPIVIDEEHDPSGFYADISRKGTLVYGTQ
jgi:uncharacterized protein